MTHAVNVLVNDEVVVAVAMSLEQYDVAAANSTFSHGKTSGVRLGGHCSLRSVHRKRRKQIRVPETYSKGG